MDPKIDGSRRDLSRARLDNQMILQLWLIFHWESEKEKKNWTQQPPRKSTELLGWSGNPLRTPSFGTVLTWLVQQIHCAHFWTNKSLVNKHVPPRLSHMYPSILELRTWFRIKSPWLLTKSMKSIDTTVFAVFQSLVFHYTDSLRTGFSVHGPW